MADFFSTLAVEIPSTSTAHPCLSTTFLHTYRQQNHSPQNRIVHQFPENQNVQTPLGRAQSAGTLASNRLEEYLCGASFKTYEFLMHNCGSRKSLVEGRRVHRHIVESGHGEDRYLANLLVQMYGKCASASEARDVFDRIRERNVFSWTLMISAYAQNGHNQEALHLFREMDLEGVPPDRITFIAMLGVCASLEDLPQGELIHARVVSSGFNKNTVAATAIFNMYAKCGSIRRARFLFETLEEKTIVSWNAMITAYAQEGHYKKAMEIFQKLDLEGASPDQMTYSALLGAFAAKGCVEEGRILHTRITACGFDKLVTVANPLINMYGKCGCPEEARKVFENIPNKDVVSWNTMVAVYSDHGYIRESLDLFSRINVSPDWITFCAVLHACSHAGLVDQACQYLHLMRSRYRIEPRREHYHCMVDVLAKAGKLKDAESLISRMPFQADASVWRTLLSACKIHGDIELGARAAFRVIELEPDESGPYILLGNMYAAAGRLEDLDRIRKLMRDRGLSARDNSPRSRGQMNSPDMGKVLRETLRLERRETRGKLESLNKQMEEFNSLNSR